MGKERDKLIRSLGEVPISDRSLPDEELMEEFLGSYGEKGRLPPDVEAVRRKMVLDGERPALLVGYGTLLNQVSMASTLGSAAEEKTPIPVIVEGYQRLFNLRPAHYEPSLFLSEDPVEVGAMNVLPSPAHRFNGLMFQVSLEELEALDERERYYDRIWVPIRSFADGSALGEAFTYAANPDSPWIIDAPRGLLPRWNDVVLAREGAYSVSREFGEAFDATTFLADGRSLVVDEYRRHLLEVQED
jgi:hypothetical protein